MRSFMREKKIYCGKHYREVDIYPYNRERLLGDYSPGRFAWVLQNPVMFKTPIPAHGKQGWWNWEEPT